MTDRSKVFVIRLQLKGASILIFLQKITAASLIDNSRKSEEPDADQGEPKQVRDARNFVIKKDPAGVVHQDGKWLELYKDIEDRTEAELKWMQKKFHKCLRKRQSRLVLIHNRRQPEERLRNDPPEMRDITVLERIRAQEHPDPHRN